MACDEVHPKLSRKHDACGPVTKNKSSITWLSKRNFRSDTAVEISKYQLVKMDINKYFNAPTTLAINLETMMKKEYKKNMY